MRHLFQHSGERPFRCQNCESGFTSINRLKEHIKKKHPDTPAAQSIMDPSSILTASPMPKLNCHPAPSAVSTKNKFTPIAPAPTKISYQPQTIMLPSTAGTAAAGAGAANTVLTNAGSMILVSNPTFTMFPNQFFLQPTMPQPLITYGILQPQVQTTFITATPAITTASSPPGNNCDPNEITIIQDSPKMDILQRAILEIEPEK